MKRFYLSVGLILGGLVMLASLACTISFGEGEPESVIPLPTRTLSEQAVIIMTVQAAPVREAPVLVAAPMNTENINITANNSAYDPILVAEGQTQFLAACSACHGADAHGLPNLGKDLVNSEFVASLTDADLLNFVKTGRPLWDPLNTTGIDMPAKGGNPALTDDNILAIITYVRSLGGGTAVNEVVVANNQPKPAENSSDYDAAVVAEGQTQFTAACSACHGADALGLPNLGKDLINSEFVDSMSDADLLTFIKTGRPIWDPLNTTGIDMPAKGGNPALTDEQILAIIAFVKSQ